jgi:dihydroorotase
MQSIKILNAVIVNEGSIREADILVRNGLVDKIGGDLSAHHTDLTIDARGRFVLPGVIDDQVHFREPGLTHKAELYTESAAAVAGGVTSYMEMPNTVPNATTIDLLEDKFSLAAQKSFANYSFYLGGANDNIEEIKKADPRSICGIKVFMGSSTGSMLVDNPHALEAIFSHAPMLIATHCEDEDTVRRNAGIYRERYGEDIPVEAHPAIRSEEACYLSSSFAVDLAKKHDTKLHVLHISTARETGLFETGIPLRDKKITAEACIHHLWFDDSDYSKKGNLIKWNPAIKTARDKAAILQALREGRIDVVATDHAPHTLEEKSNTYFKAPAGGPLIQHSLVAMLEFYHKGELSLPFIVEKMCHNPAILFDIERRGFVREGYWADLVLVDINDPWEVDKSNILAKCGWSPFEGHTFSSRISHTLVSGNIVFADGKIQGKPSGRRLQFNRI